MALKGITTKREAIIEADKVINELQARIDKNPNKFCENYGQKEIAIFTMRVQEMEYHEACDVLEKFKCVGWMSPNKKLQK